MISPTIQISSFYFWLGLDDLTWISKFIASQTRHSEQLFETPLLSQLSCQLWISAELIIWDFRIRISGRILAESSESHIKNSTRFSHKCKILFFLFQLSIARKSIGKPFDRDPSVQNCIAFFRLAWDVFSSRIIRGVRMSLDLFLNLLRHYDFIPHRHIHHACK